MKMIRMLLVGLVLMLPLTAWSEVKVNINTADAATLAEHVKGVGLKKAEAIVQFRNENGPFKSVDDLAKVKGIGEEIVEKNRAILAVNNNK
ncbi:MAG: helix-hairpin-helix domain-containing protein [Pseudomonadota bacterium]